MDKEKVLSVDELDEVSGGSAQQMAEDSQFLNELGGYCDRYGTWKTFWSDDTYNDIKRGWAKVGVKVNLDNGLLHSNKYYIDGKRVTREEAREHAMTVAGKRI